MKTGRNIKDGKMWGTISDASLFNAYFVNLHCELIPYYESHRSGFFKLKWWTRHFHGTADTPVLDFW